MDFVTLYIVVKFGVPVMIWQKTILIHFRDMRTCQETSLQLKDMAKKVPNELSIELIRCIRQGGQKK